VRSFVRLMAAARYGSNFCMTPSNGEGLQLAKGPDPLLFFTANQASWRGIAAPQKTGMMCQHGVDLFIHGARTAERRNAVLERKLAKCG